MMKRPSPSRKEGEGRKCSVWPGHQQVRYESLPPFGSHCRPDTELGLFDWTEPARGAALYRMREGAAGPVTGRPSSAWFF